MSNNIIKLLISILIIESIILVLVNGEKKADDSQQTCSKDDEICKNAEKAKGTTDGKSSTGSDKPSAEKKPPKKPTKEEKELANCPLCSYTRPLVKHILNWIDSILTDPMMIMIFNAFRDKVWELGKLTKELIGFRLF